MTRSDRKLINNILPSESIKFLLRNEDEERKMLNNDDWQLNTTPSVAILITEMEILVSHNPFNMEAFN